MSEAPASILVINVCRIGDTLLATPAIAQCNCNCALGIDLSNNMFIQFVDNFLWGHL